MATADEQLNRLLMRQEALVGSMHGLTDIMVETRNMVADLKSWLQQPPADDLPNLIAAMERALTALTEAVVRLEDRIGALLAQAGRDR
jgi:hypothetical protein